MKLYVVRPTNQRSVAACMRHGFGVLLSPLMNRVGRLVDISNHVRPAPGLSYVLDNGAWACHSAGAPWREDPLLRLLERLGLHAHNHARLELGRGFAVLPDIVGGGCRSLEFSLAWWERHRGGAVSDQVAHWALAVQDGMRVSDVADFIERTRLCIFVGGSTRWKWSTVHDWAELGLDLGVRVHVGRVNSLRRAKLCRDLGISSIDGSSVSRFATNAAKMARPHDGDDSPLPRPGRAREYLPRGPRERIAQVEPRARHAIAERRSRLALGAEP